jgi:hypothetical protein
MLASVGVLLIAARLATAQTVRLVEKIKAGDCFGYQLHMELAGKLKITQADMPVELPLTATAVHAFGERVLTVSEHGLPEKTARTYDKAHAAIKVQNESAERTLRPERRLQVAQRHKDQSVTFCPAGPLTREELELTGDHFDTLLLTGLLPGREVKVGDTWSVHAEAAQALCHFEGLTEYRLVCKLEAVNDNVARVSVTGPASGIDLGATVKLTVRASYHFDVKASRLTEVEWKQQDVREQGPVSPASETAVTYTLKRAAIEEPVGLSNVALVSVPDDKVPPATMTTLEHRDAKGRFELVYARDWHVVGSTPERLVLRLLDRGAFVAQVTITPWTRYPKGQHLSADQVREAMLNIPGWKPVQELQRGEVPAEGGRWIYRVSALGELDGIEAIQNFYLVAGPEGDQVVMLFTMTPKQAERLGARDLSLVGSLDFPAVKPK